MCYGNSHSGLHAAGLNILDTGVKVGAGFQMNSENILQPASRRKAYRCTGRDQQSLNTSVVLGVFFIAFLQPETEWNLVGKFIHDIHMKPISPAPVNRFQHLFWVPQKSADNIEGATVSLKLILTQN